MLGLSLGIDYALLMVSRFREALSAGHSPSEASGIAARQAGHTLLVSASTVAIGFAALLTVPISEIRSIGVAGFVVAGASVLLANTLLPAGLALLGTRIDAGAFPFIRRLNPDSSVHARDRWKRWGRAITSHPWTALVLAGVPLLLLASQAARLEHQAPQRGLAPGLGGIGSGLPFTRQNGARRHCPIAPGNAGASVGFDFANRFWMERGLASLGSIGERPTG